VVSAATRFNGDQARWLVCKVLQHLGPLDLHVDDLPRVHLHRMHLKHLFGNIQTDHLQAVHGADHLSSVHTRITIHDGSSVVFVKTVVYHLLGTLMPYPSEDPPRQRGFSS
jgi:hypothetical protein